MASEVEDSSAGLGDEAGVLVTDGDEGAVDLLVFWRAG